MIRLLALLIVLFIAGCGGPDTITALEKNAARRIVSLDFCADQYVLKLADPADIAALSPDATSPFSYMREQAKGFPRARPRAEDILLLDPDVVVRTYGGGPNISRLLERAGINVVQIGYANDLAAVREIVRDAAQKLDVAEAGETVVAEMDARLAALPRYDDAPSILYLTSKGATAGLNTVINDLIETSGASNFLTRQGWSNIPLEELVYQRPNIIATGFFETSDLTSDIWTPARHPVAQRALAETKTINLSGASTSCGAWFLVDAVEALTRGIIGEPTAEVSIE